MLGKLIKHEWIATLRKYSLFYLVLGMMTVFAWIMHGIPVDNVVFNMGEAAVLVLYIITVVGVLFCSVGMAVIRFYKNMVTDEGYLTFTLPVKVEELVLSKFIVAFLWQIITIVLCCGSLFLVFIPGHIEMKEVSKIISYFSEQTGTLLPVFFLLMFFTLMYQLLFYYMCIAVGQSFGSNKVIWSVVMYCIINFIMEMVLLVILLVVFAIIGFNEVEAFMNTTDGATILYSISIVWTCILGVAAYFITCNLLKKKLNLT